MKTEEDGHPLLLEWSSAALTRGASNKHWLLMMTDDEHNYAKSVAPMVGLVVKGIEDEYNHLSDVAVVVSMEVLKARKELEAAEGCAGSPRSELPSLCS